MASLNPGASAKKAKRRIQFKLDGKRKTLRLPAMTWGQACAVKNRVEQLVNCRLTDSAPSDDVSRWLTSRPDEFYARLAATGLVAARSQDMLGPFLRGYMETRSDISENTRKNWKTTINSLVTFFGDDRSLRSISAGDAEQWRRQLGTQTKAELAERKKRKLGPKKPISENTRRKYTKVVKVFFNAAVDKGLIGHNPFRKLVGTVVANNSRHHFIKREDIAKVIDACPDAEWRLLVALSRYGGLRCPSEHLALRWSDIDWAGGKMRVRSPKTEHLVGRESRFVPIFAELRPYLEEAFDLAVDGTEFVINRYRDSNVNLRTQLCRIIDRAGLDPWPRLFHNLRSTRQTELEESYPSHVACAWIGNSESVAREHYLQVTDDHFARAAGLVETGEDNSSAGGKSNARRKIRRTHYDEPRRNTESRGKQDPTIAGSCDVVRNYTNVHVVREGLEPPTKGL